MTPTAWDGPFPVMEQVSRSQIRINIGRSKDGSIRSELRRLQDIKPAFMDDSIPVAERPARGRKPRPPPTTNTTILTGRGSEAVNMADENVNNALGNNRLSVSDGFEEKSQQIVPGKIQTSEPVPIAFNKPSGRNQARSTRNPAPSYIDALSRSLRPSGA